ncbi:MAG: hypothetical protein LBD36_02975 [Holosporales bacterium]|jgi:hypothetical protein|nr:hypothetical protein [Holosporales bacterium]
MPVNNDNIYELVNVPGRNGLQISTVSKSTSPYRYNQSGSKSPWWMVSIKASKELLSSTVEGNSIYKNFAELYGFHIAAWREVSSDVSNQLFTSAMIQHEDVIILIPSGGYIADLENAMCSGTPVVKIIIQGTGWINNALKPFVTISFENSFILSVTQDGDRTFVTFRASEKSHTFFVHDQKGASKGQSVCTANLLENTSELG